MIAVLETSDPVRLNVLTQALWAAELHPFVFAASSYPGIQGSRVMVPESEVEMARKLIADIERDLTGG